MKEIRFLYKTFDILIIFHKVIKLTYTLIYSHAMVSMAIMLLDGHYITITIS